ncbi:eCIS core domain-containing protein [Aurantivibrio plasticivorans]
MEASLKTPKATQPKKATAVKKSRRSRLSLSDHNEKVVSILKSANIKVGQPDDHLEKEADRIAEQVISNAVNERSVGYSDAHSDTGLGNNKAAKKTQQESYKSPPSPSQTSDSSTTIHSISGHQKSSQARVKPPSLQNTLVSVQRVCSQCEEEVQLKKDEFRDDVYESSSHRDKSHTIGYHHTQGIAEGIRTIRHGGYKLQDPEFYQQRMGYDFSNVRIHTDEKANRLAQQLGAKAFTYGNHIVFANGCYVPGSVDGKKLLAHELAHTIQQGAVKNAIQHHDLPTSASTSSLINVSPASPDVQADLEDDVLDLWDSGVNYVSDKASSAGDAVVSGARAVGRGVARGAEYVGDLAVDAYESTRDFVLDYLEEFAPELLSFMRGDIVGTIKDKIIAGLDHLFNGFGSKIQTEGLVPALTSVFGEFTGTVKQIATDLSAGNCESLFEAMRSIKGFGEKLLGPAFDDLRAMLGMAGDFFGDLWNDYGQPAWKAIEQLAGGAWKWVSDTATWLWNQTAGLRSMASYIWEEYKRLFNVAWTETGDLLTWLKDKAAEAWEDIKEFLGPALLPLQVIAGIFALFTSMAPVVVIGVGVPMLWQAVNWVVDNWNQLEVVVTAKEILATYILPTLQVGLETLQLLLSSASTWLTAQAAAISAAVTNALTAIGAMPVLRALAGMFRTLADAVSAAFTWVADTFVGILTDIKDLVLSYKHIISPLMVLLAAVIMFPLNPWILTIVLTGWAWRILPDCFKPPIINSWLDTAIWFVGAMPDFDMFGPAWPQAKEKIIEALNSLREMSPDAKIEGANRIAKMMTGEDFTWIANLVRAAWQMPDHFIGKVEEELVGQDLNQPLPIERLPEDALEADSGQSIDDAANLLNKEQLADGDVVAEPVANTSWDPELISELNIPDGGEVMIEGGMPEEIASTDGIANELAEQDDEASAVAPGSDVEPIPEDPEEQLIYLANQPTDISCDDKEKTEEPATAQEVPAAARQFGPFTAMQRFSYLMSQMGKGISKWFNCNKHWLIPTLIIAIVALIVVIVATEGAALGVLASVMEIVAAILIGVSLVRMTAWVGQYIGLGIAGKVASSSKALAKALAIGSIELVFALMFSLGPIVKSARAGFKAARAAGKGVTRAVGAGARSSVRATGKAAKSAFVPSFEATAKVGGALGRSATNGARNVRRVGGAVIRNGRLIVNGVQDGFATGIRSLRDLRRSISRLRFNGFSMTRRGRWFQLWGHFNPKALLASGYIVDVSMSGTGKRPSRGLKVTSKSGRPGFLIGVNDEAASAFVRYAEGLPLTERQALFAKLDGMDDVTRKTYIAGISQTAENARILRGNMTSGGIRSGRGVTGGGNAAHHIVPSTHGFAAAVEARKILDSIGVDINHALNGVFVPPHIHAPLHSHRYMTEVANRLRPVLALPKSQRVAAATSVLDTMAADILAGKFPH